MLFQYFSGWCHLRNQQKESRDSLPHDFSPSRALPRSATDVFSRPGEVWVCPRKEEYPRSQSWIIRLSDMIRHG